MFYHVVRRPLHHHRNSSEPKKAASQIDQTGKLMPRYHYSRVGPTTTNSSDSFFNRQFLNGNSAKPTMTAATSNNNPTNNQNRIYGYGSFRSTFAPLATNNRLFTSMASKRDSIQIPVVREDGPNNNETTVRAVPITFINSTTTSLNASANPTANNSKTQYTSFLRPTSQYSQNYLQQNNEEQSSSSLVGNLPRLSTVPRRLSLTIPVVTNVNLTTPRDASDDDHDKHDSQSSSQNNRVIPLRFPPGVNPTPLSSTINPRTSSAVFRSPVKLNLTTSNSLARQKTDLNDSNLFNETYSSSPTRRAEIMAREAIQGIARFQEQQQGDNSILEPTNSLLSMRSPATSRRFIINLKNNQSVSLDSRLSSAHGYHGRPPIASPSGKTPLRHTIYTPLLPQDNIIPPPHPATMAAEDSTSSLSMNTPNSNNRAQFKNEFRMEIPVTVMSPDEDDPENQIQRNDENQNVLVGETRRLNINEKATSTNSNPALKSILKRSSSRETVSRKNVSFMNA